MFWEAVSRRRRCRGSFAGGAKGARLGAVLLCAVLNTPLPHNLLLPLSDVNLQRVLPSGRALYFGAFIALF